MEIRDILIYFSIIYEGDYFKIMNAIKLKEQIDINNMKVVLSRIKSSTLTIIDENYPKALKEILYPPLVLYYYGDISLINHDKILAVVGTRHPTDYGKEVTRNLILDLLNHEDIVIVSGLALGIDSIAHEACLTKGAKTIAVLANGIDNYYLKTNMQLYENIKENGLILSEYPFCVEASKENFPFRNRIIAGLAKNILVPEANTKSGTSITIQRAIEFNRNVLCVPCDIIKDSLTNSLIHDGAKMVLNYMDILEEF